MLGCCVVGFGAGTAGDVDGDGAGVTDFTDGPASVSPTRSLFVRGYIIAISNRVRTDATISESTFLRPEDVERRFGLRRGFWSNVMGFLLALAINSPVAVQFRICGGELKDQTGDVIGTFGTKAEALTGKLEKLLGRQGGTVRVHKQDGKFDGERPSPGRAILGVLRVTRRDAPETWVKRCRATRRKHHAAGAHFLSADASPPLAPIRVFVGADVRGRSGPEICDGLFAVLLGHLPRLIDVQRLDCFLFSELGNS